MTNSFRLWENTVQCPLTDSISTSEWNLNPFNSLERFRLYLRLSVDTVFMGGGANPMIEWYTPPVPRKLIKSIWNLKTCILRFSELNCVHGWGSPRLLAVISRRIRSSFQVSADFRNSFSDSEITGDPSIFRTSLHPCRESKKSTFHAPKNTTFQKLVFLFQILTTESQIIIIMKIQYRPDGSKSRIIFADLLRSSVELHKSERTFFSTLFRNPRRG